MRDTVISTNTVTPVRELLGEGCLGAGLIFQLILDDTSILFFFSLIARVCFDWLEYRLYWSLI